MILLYHEHFPFLLAEEIVEKGERKSEKGDKKESKFKSCGFGSSLVVFSPSFYISYLYFSVSQRFTPKSGIEQVESEVKKSRRTESKSFFMSGVGKEGERVERLCSYRNLIDLHYD